MSDKIALKPCPFCGKKPRMRSMRFGPKQTLRYAVFCNGCAIDIGWCEDRQEAVKAWNHRPLDGNNG